MFGDLYVELARKLAYNAGSTISRCRKATRDMKRVQQFRPEDWQTVIVELDHGP
jgi:hypothetical protein